MLYPLLSRMLVSGWLEDEWEPPSEVETGRPARRYYRITELGLRELGAAASRAEPIRVTDVPVLGGRP
ncbi:PadR family transcriptional regulator [uncultured Amnibacterium sp.]|uniref:PadR family transcriptional regulator n=1 Tax=uncultured Amnibacterium sp. TaxID=1631851 RepID=UPI0035CBF9AF